MNAPDPCVCGHDHEQHHRYVSDLGCQFPRCRCQEFAAEVTP